MQTAEYFYWLGFLYLVECLRVIARWLNPNRKPDLKVITDNSQQEMFELGTKQMGAKRSWVHYIIDFSLFYWAWAGYFLHTPEKFLFLALSLFICTNIFYNIFLGYLLMRNIKFKPINIRSLALLKNGTELAIVSGILVHHYFLNPQP